MAIQEFETPFAKEPAAADSAEKAADPLGVFKAGLHQMVTVTEGQGVSALDSLTIIREELKTKRTELMRQSSQLDTQLREADFSGSELLQAYNQLQRELILNYHQLKWLEGYYQDRKPGR